MTETLVERLEAASGPVWNAEIAQLREALKQIDSKLCEISGTKPKRSPQVWVDAAVAIEDIVEAALRAQAQESK